MNRMIPDFSRDERVNTLSPLAEVFFRRLWNKADDHGRYEARELILKAELFPLRDIRVPDISRCLQECEAAGLIACYEVAGGKFLLIRGFNQRVRIKRSKYPPPPDGHMTVICQSDDGHMSDNGRPEEEQENEDKQEEPRARGKYNPQINPPTLEQVLAMGKMPDVAMDEESCTYFFNTFSSNDWVDKWGNPVTNWVAKLRSMKSSINGKGTKGGQKYGREQKGGTGDSDYSKGF